MSQRRRTISIDEDLPRWQFDIDKAPALKLINRLDQKKEKGLLIPEEKNLDTGENRSDISESE